MLLLVPTCIPSRAGVFDSFYICHSCILLNIIIIIILIIKTELNIFCCWKLCVLLDEYGYNKTEHLLKHY
jgi:hypothetical protein